MILHKTKDRRTDSAAVFLRAAKTKKSTSDLRKAPQIDMICGIIPNGSETGN